MNPFLLAPRERLAAWKNLRNHLAARSEPAQLQQVAMFWAQCPIQRFSLDPERPATWPTPWEMLYRNDYDQNAIAIGMEMTLRLGGWDATRLALMMINDRNISDMRMVLKIDDKTVLNYNHGMVCEIPQSGFVVLYQYQFNDRVYSEVR